MSTDATSVPSGQPDDDNHQATAEHPMNTSPEPDFLDAARAEAAQITDADIEARLNRSLRRAGYSTPAPHPVPASTPQPADCTDEAARADLARILGPGLRQISATAPAPAAPWQQWLPPQAEARAARRHAEQLTTAARAEAAELLDTAQRARAEASQARADAAELLEAARRDRSEAAELLEAARREHDQALSNARLLDAARRKLADARREAALIARRDRSDHRVLLWDLAEHGGPGDGTIRDYEPTAASCAALGLARLPEAPGAQDDGNVVLYPPGGPGPSTVLTPPDAWAVASGRQRVLVAGGNLVVILSAHTSAGPSADWTAAAWHAFEPGRAGAAWPRQTDTSAVRAVVAVYEGRVAARWTVHSQPGPAALLLAGAGDEWLLDSSSLHGLRDLARGLAVPAVPAVPAITVLGSCVTAVHRDPARKLSGEPRALIPGTAPEGGAGQGDQPGRGTLASLAATALSTGNGQLAATVLQALENLAAAHLGSR